MLVSSPPVRRPCFCLTIPCFCLTILALFLTFSLSAFGQGFTPATTANAKQFLGTWQASFQGKPFVTLKLMANGNKVTGTMSHGSIELNQSGEITKAEAMEGQDPVTDLRVNGDILRVTTKSRDGSEDSNQFDLKIVEPNEAELRISVPANVPAMKPWKLQRLPAQP